MIIAARRLTRGLRRNAVTVAALAAAVAMYVALVVMTHSFRQSLDAWIGKGLIADLFIAPAANETLGMTSFLPQTVVDWLRARPEVSAADTFREMNVSVNGNDRIARGARGRIPEQSHLCARRRSRGDGAGLRRRRGGGDGAVRAEVPRECRRSSAARDAARAAGGRGGRRVCGLQPRPGRGDHEPR